MSLVFTAEFTLLWNPTRDSLTLDQPSNLINPRKMEPLGTIQHQTLECVNVSLLHRIWMSAHREFSGAQGDKSSHQSTPCHLSGVHNGRQTSLESPNQTSAHLSTGLFSYTFMNQMCDVIRLQFYFCLYFISDQYQLALNLFYFKPLLPLVHILWKPSSE